MPSLVEIGPDNGQILIRKAYLSLGSGELKTTLNKIIIIFLFLVHGTYLLVNIKERQDIGDKNNYFFIVYKW